MTASPHELHVRCCTGADLVRLEWSGMFTHHREIIRHAYERQLAGGYHHVTDVCEEYSYTLADGSRVYSTAYQ